MRIVTNAREIREGLNALRRELTRQVGAPRKQRWGFPGVGGRGEFPTWYPENAGGPLTVAIGREGTWRTRTPVFLARSPRAAVMTPTVEVNVPVGGGATDRMVNGCFCVVPRGPFTLAHRGGSLTVTPWKVPKRAVHQYFTKWLQLVNDGERETYVIPVGPVGPGLVAHLGAFADAVAALKSAWAANRGNATRVSRDLGWREELNFPNEIERVLSASSKTFTYRHGPIQASLQKALTRCLPSCCRAVLNDHIDLAILHNKTLLAIFEVKTGLDSELFSGVGQLFCYRQQFGQAATRLFLVAPADAAARAGKRRIGQLLGGLGIELILTDNKTMISWDGARLEQLLGSQHRSGGRRHI